MRRSQPPLAPLAQLPIGPPSSLVTTTQADRGRPPAAPSGHELYCFGFAGLPSPLGGSPGCWMPTNIVFSSGVTNTPVISQAAGPTRKRRVSFECGSAHNIWLWPNPA